MLDNVEFYFIHIPKTAGDSFRDALGCAFNFQDILRVNYYANGFRIENDVKEPKLINGHIPMSKLRLLDPDYKDKFIMTWLRDPVERVISHYYHERDRHKFLTPLAKFVLYNRNVMSKYIIEEDVDFVGIVERYSEDVDKLANMFCWEIPNNRVINANPHKPEVSQKTRDFIKELNQEDIALYNKWL